MNYYYSAKRISIVLLSFRLLYTSGPSAIPACISALFIRLSYSRSSNSLFFRFHDISLLCVELLH